VQVLGHHILDPHRGARVRNLPRWKARVIGFRALRGRHADIQMQRRAAVERADCQWAGFVLVGSVQPPSEMPSFLR
jgi:hypothetical protein